MSGRDDKNPLTTREQGNVSLQCLKLTESNYTSWALLMETILKAYGLWETIEVKEGAEAVDEKKVHTTKAMIFQTLPEDILMQVAQYTTAKDVWDSIKVRHLGADLVQKARLQTLRSELEALRMKENESVNDFASNLGNIRAKFKTLGTTLKDKIIVRKLLNSVPKKFLPIVASIEQYSEIDKMPFEEAVGRITAFEERLKSQDQPEENNPNKLLMASSSNQGRDRRHGRRTGKEERRHEKDTDQEDKDKPNYRCYNCGEIGHFANKCTKWSKKQRKKDPEEHLMQSLTTIL